MKAVELFAGAGGLGMGISAAGFQPHVVVEWDRYCADTINENAQKGHPLVKDWPVFCGDVRHFDFTGIPEGIELVSGGPPCQPFSIGGKHKAFMDQRDMFPQAIRAVREIKPKAFIIENVKGLTRAAFANYVEYIRLQLQHPELVQKKNEAWEGHLGRLERHHTKGGTRGLHYRLVTRLMNAADYGVPQKRERIFFVGIRSDLGVEFSFPEPTHSQDALIWQQCRSGIYWDRNKVSLDDRAISARFKARAARLDEPGLLPWVTVRDAISDLPDPRKRHKVLNHRFQDGARSYPGHDGSPFDEPAKTLKAGDHGVPGGENMVRFPDGGVRYFTVRESARLQTFPDDYVFHGSWTETMRQLGNAVPVKLACIVAKAVHEHLEKK